MAINVPLNAQLQNATQLQQQIQNAVNSVQLNLGGSGGKRALNSLSQPLGRLTGQADEFTKSLDAANARVLAFGASVGVLNAITNAFKAMVNTTIMVEKTLADINVVFNKSSSEIKNFGKGIFDVAKQTGQSFEEVSKAALEFSRQGLSVEDTLARTKDALVLTRLTGLDTARAVEGLTATINSFSKEALTSSEIINKLAAVDQKFAVSAADLTEALSRSASVAQNAGVGFEELIGIVAALQERTARGGAVIGNSLKTIFTRVRESDTLKELNRLGVAIEDINTNKLLSASEILKNLSKNAQAFGEVQKSDIFKDVGGGFQINQLIALLDDYSSAQSKAAQAQGVATGATNQAYVANEKLNQTISALINSSIEGLKELGATLGDLGIADSIKNALGVVNGFIESVQSLMEGDGAGAKFAQGIVKGIGSVLSGPGLALFGVIISKLIIDLGRFATQGLKTFLGIGKAASEQKALQEAIVITLSRNAALQSQIGKFQGNAVAQASILAGLYNQQEASLRRQNAIASGMSSVLFRQGMRAGPQGFTQTGRAAGGYLPSAEAADVSRGVGGASPSAQVVSIPNFAFGNGKRGTMVANTSEYIVPNYANGGSAIFNQDMVRSMGLPAGAQKIRAAGGYVPNFAKVKKETGEYNALEESKGTNLVIDAQRDLGGIGMMTIGGNADADAKPYYFDVEDNKLPISSFPALAKSKWDTGSKVIPKVIVKNIQGSNGLAAFDYGKGPDEINAKFSEELSKTLIPPIASLANKIFKLELQESRVGQLSSSGDFLSQSAEGSIFQEMVALANDKFTNENTAFKGEDNRSFDFNSKGPASTEFLKQFFINGGSLFKVDAKRTDTSDARRSMVKKIFNDAEVFQKLINNRREDIFPQVSEGELSFNRGSARGQKFTKQKLSNYDFNQKASKGYIPNFANKALTDSINRERIESGLPISAISITQDSRLMNPRNPTGLAVINSRDEPNGKIPNFAAQSPAPTPLTAADFNITKAASKALSAELDNLNKEIKKFTIEVSKGTKTEAEAKAALDSFVQGLKNPQTKKALLSTSAQQKVQDVAGRRLSESIAQNPAPVAKGFGDVVGKIFLFQTALSFATGAAGELTSSAEKLAAKFSETLTNVASFGLLGQQLLQSNPAGALAKFGKNLGLVGLGVGVLYEGFKLADFAIKEFSGENAKVASSLAKLNDASKILAIKFEELSETRQLQLKTEASNILGSSGFKSIWGELTGSMQGGGEIGGNKDVQESAAKLLAQGATKDQIQSILSEAVKPVLIDIINPYTGQKTGTRVEQETSLSKVLEKFEENTSGGLGQQLSEKNRQFRMSTAGLDISSPDYENQARQKGAEAYGAQNYGALAPEVQAVVDENIKKQREANKLARDSADIENATNLGKRLSLDIAKLEVDNAVELTRKKIEGSNAEEDSIKLRMETLNITNAEKIALESKLKTIELEKKLRVDILNSVKEGVDKAAASNIDITKESLDQVKNLLANTDFSKIDLSGKTGEGVVELGRLKGQLQSIGSINAELAQNIIDSIKTQIDGKKESYEFDLKTNDALRDQSLLIDKNKQAYEGQLSAITRIAALAKATSDVNISGLGIDKASINSQISTLENSNTNPYLGILDKQANERSILELRLQQLEVDRKINAENQVSNTTSTNAEIEKKKQELEKLRTSSTPKYYGTDEYKAKYAEITNAISILEKDQVKNSNDLATGTLDLEASISRLKNELDNLGKRGTFTEGLRSGLQELENSTLDFQNTLGKEIPQLFSSNLSQGLNDAISGAKSLKEALTDAATSFLNAITQKNIENLANMFTVGVGGIGKANGGMISGGSGTKDDVPAMLMGGEYVVKKSAVKKYGSNFLDSLNQGKLSGYATGGAVQSGKGGFYAPGEYGQGAITGQRQLLDFATQDFTSGQFDQLGSYGMTGASINLEAESGRLTMAGRENSPIFERTQQAKEEAFQVYLQSLQVDKQYQEQLKQIEEADKARKKQLTTAIVSAVASTALSAASSGFSNAYGASAGKPFLTRLGSGLSGALGKGGITGKGGLGNLFSGNFSSAFTNLNSGFQKPTGYTSGIVQTGGDSSNQPNLLLPSLDRSSPVDLAEQNPDGYYHPYPNPRRANGGPIFGGSGVRDDVPAMLTGGEFVLNNRATKKIGMSNLQRLNSGDTSFQQDPEKGSSDLMQALISKLDELISATSKSGGDNVVVNVNSNEAQGERNNGQQSANEKDLHKKIKAAVLEVITQEKRLGGSLNK